MSIIYILCIEDEAEVLDVIVNDISALEVVFPIEVGVTANEARKVIDEILDNGDRIGLILCDHVLPGENGVELLVELQGREETKETRKVLLTGQAGLDATIKAVNKAGLNRYIAKPWDKEDLVEICREELTHYVINTTTNLLPYMGILNAEKLSEAMRERGLPSDA
ncbi:MAG: response regulator [Balneolaceae bacterium]|nr:MAG: response regulator [Balneolaceae bacterium]